MAGPEWIRWVWTLVFLAMAGYCVVRLVAANQAVRYGPVDRLADTAHFLISLGMAVMFSPVGGPFAPASWQALFCVLAVWSLTRFGDNRPDAWHVGAWYYLVTSAAMVYMLVHDGPSVESTPWAVHGTSGAGVLPLPELAWAFAVFFGAHAVWMVLRPRVRIEQYAYGGDENAHRAIVYGAGARSETIVWWANSDTAITACHLMMALGMGYMLVIAR